MQFARHRQSVGDERAALDEATPPEPRELGIQEADVERCIVDQHLGPIDEGRDLVG